MIEVERWCKKKENDWLLLILTILRIAEDSEGSELNCNA
jgi:hypothetical protein